MLSIKQCKKKIICLLVIMNFIGIYVMLTHSSIPFDEASPVISSDIPHDPVEINGNDEFISENGVYLGNGSAEDPYIIPYLYIDDSSANWGINIMNTDKHCIIQEVEIINTKIGGIRLFNTANVTINNCIIHSLYGYDGENANSSQLAEDGWNIYGISVSRSENTKIIGNTIKNIYAGDGGDGYSCDNTDYCDGGSGGDAWGIYVTHIETAYNILIENNTITNIFGGYGGWGQAGASASTSTGDGTTGGNGGIGGSVYGIYVYDGIMYITNNTCSDLLVGGGGYGGDGGYPGDVSGVPGDGGNGGDSGCCYGIYCDTDLTAEIVSNTLSNLRQNRGGDGGDIGLDLHNTGFTASQCYGGDTNQAYGIYLRVQSTLILGNHISFMYDRYPGYGGSTEGFDQEDGECLPLYGLYLLIYDEGIISENIVTDFIQVNGFSDFGILLRLEKGFYYLNHLCNHWDLYFESGNWNKPKCGNYYELNTQIQDLDPVDGISDIPFVLDSHYNYTDYAPLAYPLVGDEDQDGLSNLEEYKLQTNIISPDSDGDSIPDLWEVNHGFNPISSQDSIIDHDLDGLNLLLEYYYGTNYFNPDTDGDGWNDGDEIRMGYDPLDETVPQTTTESETTTTTSTSTTSSHSQTNTQDSSSDTSSNSSETFEGSTNTPSNTGNDDSNFLSGFYAVIPLSIIAVVITVRLTKQKNSK